MWCIKLSRFFKKCRMCIIGYCRTTNLHGFRNIAPAKVKWHESCFWQIICFCSTVMTIIMFSTVWERFQRSPTMTTIETNNYPIKFIPFPAITLCNMNKVLKTSFHLLSEKFKKHGITEWQLQTFLKQIPQIYSTRLTHFQYEEIIDKVLMEMNYTLENFMFDLSQPCSEFLVRCIWLGTDYNCSELFYEVKTSEGFCCSFNWRGPKITNYEHTFLRKAWNRENDNVNLTGSEKGIFVEEASTSLSGLTVILDPDENNYFAAVDSFFGSMVILHSMYQYPDVDAPRVYVQPRSEAMVRLKASVIESSKNVRSLNVRQRQCYFEEEYPVEPEHHYTNEACSLYCKLSLFSKICGCIPFYYPNMMDSKPCRFTDMKCIRQNRAVSNFDTTLATNKWSTEVENNKCTCLPSCNDVHYDWIIQTNEIHNPEYASPIFRGKLGNKSAISIFFGQNVCVKYRVESLVTWDSLIASFGGIFGLCLGGSIISVIELIHYFLYDSRKLYTEELQLKKDDIVRRNSIQIVNSKVAVPLYLNHYYRESQTSLGQKRKKFHRNYKTDIQFTTHNYFP